MGSAHAMLSSFCHVSHQVSPIPPPLNRQEAGEIRQENQAGHGSCLPAYGNCWGLPGAGASLLLTQAVVSFVWVALVFPPPATHMLKYHGHVAEDDERRGQNRPLVERHDELVPLKFPDLVGYRLYLKKRIAETDQSHKTKKNHYFLKYQLPPSILPIHPPVCLKSGHSLEDRNQEVDQKDVCHQEIAGHDGRHNPCSCLAWR